LNADKLIERAEAEAGRKNFHGAIEYFTQALTVDPAHRKARRGVREAELKKFEHGYPSGATRFLTGMGPRFGLFFARFSKDRRRRMEALEKVLATDPRNVDLGMRLGSEAEAAQFPTAAAAAYEGILLGNPEHVGAMKSLGRVLHVMGEIDEAARVLENAVRVAPRDAEVQRLRKDIAALGYARDAGFASARTTHDLLKDKDQTKKLEQANRVVRGAEDAEAQVQAARAAAAKAPTSAAAWSDLGAAEAAVRGYDAAEKAYLKACELAPDEHTYRTRLGDVRISRGERSLTDLREKAAAGDAAAKARLADAEKAHLATLTVEYRARVAAHPTDLGLRYALGGYLEKSGDVDAAITEYQHSVKDPRRRPESLAALGRCFLAKGMLDLAAKQLEKALEESSQAGGDRAKSILYDLATVKEKQGDVAKARECLARIYEVDIAYRDVAGRLERLQKAAPNQA
jgi:tetratricopeptide (TPR) repeat protein